MIHNNVTILVCTTSALARWSLNKPKEEKKLLFWDVTQPTLVVTDVSGQPIVPIFKGQAVFGLLDP
jgi:hypothetical protein